MTSWTSRPCTIAAIALLLALDVAPARAAQWQYEAVSGDTPLGVCRRFTRAPGCSLALARLNNIPPRAPIPAGTPIRIQADWLKKVPIVGGVLESGSGASYLAIDEHAYAPLVAGEPVYLGDTIRTGPAGVVLEFLSGLMIEVRPHSELVLQSVVGGEEEPVVDIDIVHGSASVASPGGADTTGELAGGSLHDLDPAQDATLLANAERLLEEAPPAAGGHARSAVVGPDGTLRDVLREALRPTSGNTRDSFVPAHMEWPRDPDARAWQVTLLALPRRIDLKQVLMVDEPMLTLPDLAVGCYEVEIRPLDEHGTAGVPRAETLCVHRKLDAPGSLEVHSPGGEPARLAWNAVEYAAGYTVEVAADPGFERITATLATAEPAVTLPAQDAGPRYVRVRARNAAGLSGPAGATQSLP